MAHYRIETVRRDGISETFFAYEDAAGVLHSDLRSATLTGSARHQLDGTTQTLTVALADGSDAARMNEMVATADLSNWSAGVYDAQIYIASGGTTETTGVFEILVNEDI